MGETLTKETSPSTEGGVNLDDLRSSRVEAIAAGDQLYFDGKSCKRDHNSPRYAASGACVECVKFLNLRFREENPTAMREYKRQWRAANPGAHAARARSYRSRNLEKVRETERTYWQSNPDRKAAKDANRRARRNGAEGKYTTDDIKDILSKQKYKCACCSKSVQKKKDRHIDHIIPLAKGGSNWPSNLQILCVACNLSKGDKLPEEFMRIKGFLI